MSTDRDLLELAAKAAGYEIDSTEPFEIRTKTSWQEWNPLTDDGDAFRLSVGLELNISQGVFSCMVDDEDEIEHVEICGPDRAATTRRLIVLAAAEIGKAMP